jgi:hypothetical protein
VTAAGAAALGARVALVERNQMGGDCLNFGCVPSKALISSARLLHRIRHSERWGVAGREPAFDFEQIFAQMRAARAELAPLDSQERFESLGVDVFREGSDFCFAAGNRGRRSEIARPSLRHRDGLAGGDSRGDWGKSGALFHERNGFRRVEGETGKFSDHRGRPDRLRAGADV